MARYPLTGSRVSLSASTRERGTHWKGATTAVSSWRSRLWKSWEDCWQPHQTVGVIRRFPVWLRPRQRHYRHNLCCQAAAREVSSCQETLHVAFVDLEKVFEYLRRSSGERWENLLWRSGLCNWCRECMQMHGAVSVSMWGSVKSLKWRLVFTKDQYLIRHCAWSLITRVPLWGPLWGPMLMSLLSSLEECVGRLLTWKETMESKCRKDRDHDLRYRTGPPAEFRWVSIRRLVPLEWAATASSAMAASTGCTRNALGSSAWQRPWLQMYTVPGNCMPLGWQTTEGSPGRTWHSWGGSFLLLLRRHAVSSRWLWTFKQNTCENRLEEVQGFGTSSLFTTPLFQNTWPCVQLLSVERNAPCLRDLAIDKAEPPASAAKRQGNDQTDLQCQATRHCHQQVQWATMYLCGLALRIWTSFWMREDSDGMDM